MTKIKPTVTAEAAWGAYLKATRDLEGDRYVEMESWAWERLRDELATAAKGGKVGGGV